MPLPLTTLPCARRRIRCVADAPDSLLWSSVVTLSFPPSSASQPVRPHRTPARQLK